jgi:hypothetical protein
MALLPSAVFDHPLQVLDFAPDPALPAGQREHIMTRMAHTAISPYARYSKFLAAASPMRFVLSR